MGIRFHDAPIHERARIALVAVADEIFLVVLHLRGKLPFFAGRKARAAAPAQAGFQNFVNHLLRRHLRDRFAEREIAVSHDVIFDGFGINLAAPAQHDPRLFRLGRAKLRIGAGKRHGLLIQQPFQPPPFQQVFLHEFIHVFFIDADIMNAFGIDDEFRPLLNVLAQARGFDDLNFILQIIAFQGAMQFGNNRARPFRQTLPICPN